MVHKTIISDIFPEISFSNKEIQEIILKFKKLEFKKGTIIVTPNKTMDYQLYVLDGCLRSYYEDDNAKEHTVQFAIKDWWISDYTSFFGNTKSIMSIEVLKDATVYKLSRTDMNYLCDLHPKISNFFRQKLELAFASFQKRILQNSVNSAENRYLSFIKKYPLIEKSVKNYHIASYLGITSESLSRIRSNLKFK
ncbi:Crp/Fnr family transcriptional regulator [Polaribacter sp.]|uniref:Crp/Fnr family transcriptional regulator n=1 Tax=Polaribacter sp. TaxID=1920175 RepID=UPI003F6BC2E2